MAAKTAKSAKKATKAAKAAPTPYKIRRFGWNPDLPDQRDFMYAAPAPFQANIPPFFDLTSKCPPVYDQGQLGSCTANAISGAIEFDQMKQGITAFMPSRLFIYYNERVIEGTVSTDSGAQIRDGIKTVAAQGVPPETDWPYNIAKFAQKPPVKAYNDAKPNIILLYQRLVQNLNTLKGCLASGYPFVFGFTAYESLESAQVAKTGILPMPASGEQVVGGHAVLCVGYDDKNQQFIVRNSWAATWGQKGYFRMPYAYLTSTSLASDLWTIRSVK